MKQEGAPLLPGGTTSVKVTNANAKTASQFLITCQSDTGAAAI